MTTPADIPFQQLIDALLNEDVPFHPRFLYRLSDLEPGEIRSLEQAWPRVSSWRRQALLEDLEDLGDSDFVLSFEAVGRMALRDPEPDVRMSAIRMLWEYEDPQMIPVFVEMMLEDANEGVRAEAATALGRFVYLGELDELPKSVQEKVEESLLTVAQGKDQPLIRRRALESLGYSGRKEMPALIDRAYNSGKRDWLLSALVAMGRSANERYSERVLSMLDNPSTAIRTEAARAAGGLEIRAALQPLLNLLEDEDDEVRMAAAWALSEIGGPGVREAIEELLEKTEDEEEADYLEEILDNLAFTEDMGLFSIFNLPEDAAELPEEEADEFDDDILDLLDDEASEDEAAEE